MYNWVLDPSVPEEGTIISFSDVLARAVTAKHSDDVEAYGQRQ